jgi:hypothetical protein
VKRLALAALLLLAAPAFSQTLTFTVESTTSGGTAVVPRLTWTTSPAGATCTASNGWTGTKAASGTELLPAISATKSYTLTCAWPGIQTAVVSWVAPTTNTDGSALTNLQGYRVQWGTSAAALNQSKYTENLLTTWTSPTLAAGTWFFGVRAYNSLGLESDISNVVSKVTTASASQTRTLEVAIKFPNPPTNLTVE